MPAPTVSPLVLAAGLCRRFGGGKLSALYRGRPLLAHVLGAVAEARALHLVEGGVVVHRPDDQTAIALAAASGFQAIVNPRPASGLSRSLQLGLSALQPSRAEWALVVLGDQPRLRSEVIGALVAAARPSVDLIRPAYADAPDAPGHPVLVHRRLWDRARSLTGDQGFRVLATWSGVRAGEVPVPGMNPDIDTPEDLAALEAAHEQ
jgi:molybdenum cofactor cytidylyltransferase